MTLAATIDRNGTVTKARVVEPAATSNEAIASLAVEALNNLKTWHLEPASRTDDVQLSYEYTMDLGLRAGEVTAHFDLPDRIRIRANPTKR